MNKATLIISLLFLVTATFKAQLKEYTINDIFLEKDTTTPFKYEFANIEVISNFIENNNIKSHYYFDVNKDGRTDILMNNNSTIYYKNKNGTYTRKLFKLKDYTTDIFFKATKDTISVIEHTLYFTFQTLDSTSTNTNLYEYHFGHLLKYNPDYKELKIDSIHYKSNPSWEGIQEITLTKKNLLFFTDSDSKNATYKTGYKNKNLFEELTNLINYGNVTNYPDQVYSQNGADFREMNLTIYFRNGTVKTFRDYGVRYSRVSYLLNSSIRREYYAKQKHIIESEKPKTYLKGGIWELKTSANTKKQIYILLSKKELSTIELKKDSLIIKPVGYLQKKSIYNSDSTFSSKIKTTNKSNTLKLKLGDTKQTFTYLNILQLSHEDSLELKTTLIGSWKAFSNSNTPLFSKSNFKSDSITFTTDNDLVTEASTFKYGILDNSLIFYSLPPNNSFQSYVFLKISDDLIILYRPNLKLYFLKRLN